MPLKIPDLCFVFAIHKQTFLFNNFSLCIYILKNSFPSPHALDSSGRVASPVGPPAAEDQGEGHASPAGPETGPVPAWVWRCPGLDQWQGRVFIWKMLQNRKNGFCENYCYWSGQVICNFLNWGEFSRGFISLCALFMLFCRSRKAWLSIQQL